MNSSVTSYVQSEISTSDSPAATIDATTETIMKRHKRDDSDYSTDGVSGFTQTDEISNYSDSNWNWNMTATTPSTESLSFASSPVTATTPTAETPPLYRGLNSSATCASCPRKVRNLDDDHGKYTGVPGTGQ